MNFVCWNIGGLSSDKFRSVQDFLAGFNVVCLQETWLEGGTESRFELPNHSQIGVVAAIRRGERGRRAGGMLLFISKKIEPYTVKIDVPFLRNNMLWLDYTPLSGNRYVIGFLYNPP